MKPPFNYHGGKSRVAVQIAGMLPPHGCYVEPFAGSAAVLFAKRASLVEVVNDQDHAVSTFFRVLRGRCDELVEVCRLTPYSRGEHAWCRREGFDGDVDDVEVARRFFVLVSQSFGSILTTSGWSRPSAGCPEASKVQSLVDRFQVCAQRLATAHLECQSALDVIAGYDDADTAMYVDPPYLAEVRSWSEAQRFKQDYRVEMQTVEEHVALLDVLVGCESAIILSGKQAGLYEDRLSGWFRFELAGGEVLWSNRPLVEHMSLF